MLEKEFVPYNLAKQIKQLGFKQECFGYYIDVEVANPFLVKNIISDDQGGYFTLAPTFSQAFRWFREKCKISGEISSDFYLEGKDNEWEYNTYQLGKDDGYIGTINIFKTYEEAELECLKKLIEIVKNGNI